MVVYGIKDSRALRSDVLRELSNLTTTKRR